MIERAPRTGNFTIIPNESLRDKRLSFRARGVLAYILSMPDGWQTTADRIADAGPEGRDAIRSVMTELEKNGYVQRIKYRVERGRLNTKVVVYDAPAPDRPAPDNPSPVPPAETRESPGGTDDWETDSRSARPLLEDVGKKTSGEDIKNSEEFSDETEAATSSPPASSGGGPSSSSPRPPGSSSSEPSGRARAKNETETTNNHNPSTSTSSDPEGAQQHEKGRLSNELEEPENLFGEPAKPKPKVKSKAQVDRWLPSFLELYPMDAQDSSQHATRQALQKALTWASWDQILEGLRPWLEYWEADGFQYVKNSASWLSQRQWEKGPVRRGAPRTTQAAPPRAPAAISASEDPLLHEPERPPLTDEDKALIAEIKRIGRENLDRHRQGLPPLDLPDLPNKEHAAS